MIFKAVTVFLVVILLLGMFGKLHVIGIRKPRKKFSSGKCRSCGAQIPGKGPCPCQRQGGN